MAVVKQYDAYWVNLDPTIGSEIKKTRPCVIISPDVSNRLLHTVLVAPVTSALRDLPMRLPVELSRKKGDICLDQIRCVDKTRLTKKMGKLTQNDVDALKLLLKEYLVD
jgi:mRNA interferase MazF